MSDYLLNHYNRNQFKLSLLLLIGGFLYLFLCFILQFEEKKKILDQQSTYVARAVRNDLISGNQFYIYEQCRSLLADMSIEKLHIERSGTTYCNEEKANNSFFVIQTVTPITYNPDISATGPNVAGTISLSVNCDYLILSSLISLILFVVLIYFYWLALKKSQEEVGRRVIAPINELAKVMKTDSRNVNKVQEIKKGIHEDDIRLLFDSYINLTDEIINAEKTIMSKTRDETIIDISKQVAHDIRSPLATLNIITTTINNISEDKRIAIRNSVQRINDIANNLLESCKKTSQEKNVVEKDHSTELVYSVVESVISEKRIYYLDNPNVSITFNSDKSYALFSIINPSELKRVISNLINNSIEARRHNSTIVVNITIEPLGSQNLIIKIQDNGKGIPASIFSRLGDKGVSKGKDNSESGSGLGIYHAKQTIESIGGILKIESESMDSSINGTIISIILPRAETPSWFINELLFDPSKKIISLDDDIFIHQIWTERLTPLAQRVDKNLDHIIFRSGEDLIREAPDLINVSTLFLIDLELLGQSLTGLEVIEEISKENPGILAKAILVTNRFEDIQIRENCIRLGIKLIPKIMAGIIPIEVRVSKPQFDAVLLDDDELVRLTWAIQAKKKNVNLKIYTCHQELLNEIDQFEKSTPFYIDSNLGEDLNGTEIKGEIILEQLFKMGFKELFLCTGYEPENFSDLKFIKKVLSKNPQF